MEELLERVIRTAFILICLKNMEEVMTSDCFEIGESKKYFEFGNYIKNGQIPENDVITFKPYIPEFGKYEIIFNYSKLEKIRDFYDKKISLKELLGVNSKAAEE